MSSHLIDNQWIEGRGDPMTALNPTDGSIAWQGFAATHDEVDAAVRAARKSLPAWSMIGLASRIERVQQLAARLQSNRAELIQSISISTGKPLWESATEVDAMVNKIALSIEIETRRNAATTSEAAGVRSTIRFKPHGVCVVIGPFNFPGHLPNGHIIPALLAGNTIIYKPSELTPLVAERYAQLFGEAGLASGVFNLLQGDRVAGDLLVRHPDIDGVFFTGSHAAGLAIARASVDRPGRIVALEMGGNNPLVVHRVADAKAAAYAIVQSAFITAGQRCSCARRLILLEEDAGAILHQLTQMTRSIAVGAFSAVPEPFIGPLISDRALTRALDRQAQWSSSGGRVLLEARRLPTNGNFLSPGIVDVTGVAVEDDELFAPLLQVVRVARFDDAIVEANRTRFGLAAGLLSDEPASWERFYAHVRAGVVNWNRPTTGASSALPFGGVGSSGNHRPSAAAAAEYCSYPVAVMELDRLVLPAKRSPGITVD